MVYVDDIVAALKFEAMMGDPGMPVPRDRLSTDYYNQKRFEESLRVSRQRNYKVKIEFSPATRVATKQEYLHSNITYSFSLKIINYTRNLLNLFD